MLPWNPLNSNPRELELWFHMAISSTLLPSQHWKKCCAFCQAKETLGWGTSQYWAHLWNGMKPTSILKAVLYSHNHGYPKKSKNRFWYTMSRFSKKDIKFPSIETMFLCRLIPLVLSWNLLIPWFQNFQKTWTGWVLTKVNTRPTLVHCATTSMVGWSWPKVSFFLTMLVKLLVLFFPTLYLTNRKNN